MTSSLLTVTAFFAGDKRFYIRGVDYQPGMRIPRPLSNSN
jgi:hypothetical protein